MSAVRIAIIGSPRAGKTTLALRMAEQLGLPVTHSDDFIRMGWSAQSEEIANRIRDAPHMGGIFEGGAVVRALRKLLATETDRPVQRCVLLTKPLVPLSDSQDRMRLGCATVLAQILPELERRGVEIVRPRGPVVV